ncbi:MAG: DUF1573 domain-containing protein [Ignavibacteriae bacterium]|nr:DUF1573 domain-containing protein [Ignavibacteriota bacterium]MCB9214756.1 DUF1573 domain-containing protein [Ignavibacteria bacterium]
MNTQRLLSVALTFALLGILPLSTQAQEEKKEGSGKLEVVDSYDWGTIAPGKLQADIQIKNVGDGQLQIENVKPSCGCTAAPLDDYLLDPGETTTMHVTLDARHNGPIRKSITIYSDDPTNATRFVQLTANIQTDVSFNPDVQWLVFNNATVGKETMTSIRIMNSSEKNVTIYPPEVSGTDAPVSFSLVKEQVLKPGEEVEMVARLLAEKPMQIEGKVTLKTSAENMPERVFTLYGQVVETATSTTPSQETSSVNHN